MMNLIEFLLARIAEDEAAADLVLRPYGDHASTNEAEWWPRERDWFGLGLSSDETPLLTRMTPQRVLAECEAKRRIVGLAQRISTDDARSGALLACHLALPYANHPDYDEAWRP